MVIYCNAIFYIENYSELSSRINPTLQNMKQPKTQITSETRLIDLTVGQLMELQSTQAQPSSPRIILSGMKEFASFLKVSIATAHRIKKSGIIRPAVSQFKKTIIIDGNLALELLKEADSPWTRKINRTHP